MPVIAAISAALVAHVLLFSLIRRRGKRDYFAANTIALHTAGPMRALLVLIAISIVLPIRSLSLWLQTPAQHTGEIAYIIAVAWLAYGIVEVFATLVRHHLPENSQDEVRARRTRTQVHLLRRMLTGLLVFGALAGE